MHKHETPACLLHCLAIQGSPLDLASLNSSRSSNTTSDPSTISATSALSLNTSIPVVSNITQKGTTTSGLVTIVKTIELIPQPASGDSSTRSRGFSDQSSGAGARQTKLATISPSAKLSATSSRISLSGQVPAPYAADQLDKSSMLQPIVVGGITYAPEYLADHASSSDGLDHVAFSLWQGEGGLPPVVVGGLTYTQVAKGFQSGMLPTGPVNVVTAVTETGKVAVISMMKGSESRPAHSISMPTQYSAVSKASSPMLSRFESLTLPSSTSSLALPVASKAFVPLGSTVVSVNGTNLSSSGPATMDDRSIISLASGGLVIGSSTFPPTTPSPTTAITTNNTTIAPTSVFATMSSQFIIPASPSTFIIASQTFTAYPSGLAIAGTEVFQGSTAITVSGTAISLGRSDIVIGTSTVPFASITGLGAALSSGLVPTVTNAPGVGSGTTATATSATESHRSAGGISGRKVEMVMVWLVITSVFIAMR
ncbi:hypothetical protein BDR22DRAFT_697890 [Usnea florida]